MNELILAGFSIFIYLSTVGFFWGIHRENCSARDNSMVGKTFPVLSAKHLLSPANRAYQGFLQMYWRPLALFGVLFLGIFGFFIEHVCNYQ